MRRALFPLLGLAACGGDPPPVDAPPQVVTSAPAQEAERVPIVEPLSFTFSQAVDPRFGRLRIGPIAAVVGTSSLTFSSGDTVVSYAPPDPWPYNTAVLVAVEEFRDPSGNLAPTFLLLFTTELLDDPDAPRVLNSTPGENARSVDAAIADLRFGFDEAMDAATGTVSLSGGPGYFGPTRWEGLRAIVPVFGLAAGRSYRATLAGFADLAGNALDGSAYLGDGALDFATATE